MSLIIVVFLWSVGCLSAPALVVVVPSVVTLVAATMVVMGTITVELVHLVGSENTGQGVVAYFQVATVVTSVQMAEVADVDLIDPVILILGEAQLHGHIICCLASFHASLLAIHGCSRSNYRHHHYEGKHHLLHNRKLLKGSTFLFLVHSAKVGQKTD